MDIIKSSLPISGSLESQKGGRQENQDFLGYADTPLGFLVVLCDGMGGGPAGRMASEMTVGCVIESVKKQSKDDSPKQALESAISLADSNILQAVAANPSLNGMGTTIVCFLFNRQSAWVAHVGDSRFYQFRFGRKVYRSTDHSFVSEMVQKGSLTEEQARLSSQSNIITRAINGRGIATPDVVELPYEKGDKFMLCTDGIWGSMPEPQLIRLATKKGNLSGVVVQLAYDVDGIGVSEGGKHDNLTVALLETSINSVKKVPMSKRIISILAVMALLTIASLLFGVLTWQKAKSELQRNEQKIQCLVDSINRLNGDLAHKGGLLEGKEELEKELKNAKIEAERQKNQAVAEKAKAEADKAEAQKKLDEQQKEQPRVKPQQTGGNTQTVNKGKFSQVINTLVGWIENINKGNPITKQSMLQMRGQLEGKVSNNDLIHIDKAVQYYVNKEYSRQKAELEKLTEILKKK